MYAIWIPTGNRPFAVKGSCLEGIKSFKTEDEAKRFAEATLSAGWIYKIVTLAQAIKFETQVIRK